jgi:putative transposase
VNGERRYLWRAVDHEGEVLESYVTIARDKAALKFIKKALKRHGRTQAIITDGLASYDAALKALNAKSGQAPVRRWKNNRAENSHLPFRRRERAMNRFRRMKTLQKFAAVHASVHNHFSQERHLVSREIYKQRRSAALAEWRAVVG